MTLWKLVALVAAVVLTFTTGASYGKNSWAPEERRAATKVVAKKSKTKKASPSCPGHVAGLIFYRNRFIQHRMQIGSVHVDFERPKDCDRAVYLAKRWKKRAYKARVHLENWRYTLRDFKVTPGNHAWLKAVDEAQKVFPGTKGWLLSCSSYEGGWGRWVVYGGGSYYEGYSGVGGWLQFMPGTFWRMFDAAQEDVYERLPRYDIPASAASWLSPLGQALAGAWGYLNGRKHEWAGYGCR